MSLEFHVSLAFCMGYKVEPLKLSFTERCLLFGVSIIWGPTVAYYNYGTNI